MKSLLVFSKSEKLTDSLRGSLDEDLEHFESLSDLREALKSSERPADVILVDVEDDSSAALDISRFARTIAPHTAVILMTDIASVELAVDALRVGAVDFLIKPIDDVALLHSINRAREHSRMRREIKRLRAHIEPDEKTYALSGESAAMVEARSLVKRVARRSKASVLVTGESGTGKEVVAKTIHEGSPRKDKPFIAINCSAIPEALLESQLFGHEKGAFTSAQSASTGLLLQAQGGTIFLDEIGDMPLSLQPKILRVLQERRVRPVGSSKEHELDVRFIAATHRNLESEIEAGRFRMDLYYRLAVIEIDLPPLRFRESDVLQLAQQFLIDQAARTGVAISSFSAQVARALLNYHWPGNVRELMNVVERAVALAEHDIIDIDDLPSRLRTKSTPKTTVADDNVMRLDEIERRHILKVFEMTKRNKVRSAHLLGIDRKTLRRKLQKYGITPPEVKG